MEQLNNELPVTGEENQSTLADLQQEKISSPLLLRVRQNYGIFGGISLIFGGTFAFCFYNARIGLNSLLFILIMVGLLITIAKKLEIPVQKTAYLYYLGAILLGLSNMLTSSPVLHFLNIIGAILLLELSLLVQYQKNERWDFSKYLIKMLSLPFQTIASVGMPFVDANQYFKKTKLLMNDKIRNILIGILISIPLLFVISALLSSSDLLFGKITTRVYESVFSTNLFQVILMVLFGFVFCYAVVCGAVGSTASNNKEKVKADPQIAITVTTLLGILYAVFCAIQIAYLFAGGMFVLPEEFTYAEYARRGFFELLTVTCFNLLLILFCTNVFKDSKLLRGNLSFMTATTYVMIASSAYRMFIYIGAYHLTFLRVFVLLFLLIDAIILAGIIIYVYNKKFPLFGYGVAVISVCYLLFSFSRPDYFIASYQIKQDNELDAKDLGYLTRELSMDAAPVVLPVLFDLDGNLPANDKEMDNQYEARYIYEFTKADIDTYYNEITEEAANRDIRDFNLSYSTASRAAKQYPNNK